MACDMTDSCKVSLPSVGVLGCAMMESGISRLKNSLVGVTKNVAALGLSFFIPRDFSFGVVVTMETKLQILNDLINQ